MKTAIILLLCLILCTACNSDGVSNAANATEQQPRGAVSVTATKNYTITYRAINGELAAFIDIDPPLRNLSLSEINERVKKNDAAALYELSRRLTSPSEPPATDSKRALELLVKAANLNDPDAQNELGLAHAYGQLGFNKDPKQAVEWFQKAADQGHMEAQHNLAGFYKEGLGTAVNKAKAVELLQKSARQGSPLAKYELGMCYRWGEGISEDKEKALDLFYQAAEAGSARAELQIGNMYDFGDGVAVDKKKAFEHYKKGAELGYP